MVLQRQQEALQHERDQFTLEQEELAAKRRAFLSEHVHAADVGLMSREKALMERERVIVAGQHQVECEKEALTSQRQIIESHEMRGAIQREEWGHSMAEKESNMRHREALILARERRAGTQLNATTQTPIWREATRLIPSRRRWRLLFFILVSLLLLIVARVLAQGHYLTWSLGRNIVSPPIVDTSAHVFSDSTGHSPGVYEVRGSATTSIQARIHSTPHLNKSVRHPTSLNESTANPGGPWSSINIDASVGALCGWLTWFIAHRTIR